MPVTRSIKIGRLSFRGYDSWHNRVPFEGSFGAELDLDAAGDRLCERFPVSNGHYVPGVWYMMRVRYVWHLTLYPDGTFAGVQDLGSSEDAEQMMKSVFHVLQPCLKKSKKKKRSELSPPLPP